MSKQVARKTGWIVCWTIVAAVAIGILVSRPLWADDDDNHHSQTPSGATATESLEHAMKGMSQAFKTLHKQIADPTKNESSLAAVAELQRHTLVAKELVPEKIESLPADKKADALGDYRGMMINVLREELDLEEQLMAGKNDKAAETLKSIGDLEKQGHSEFRSKDD